MNYSDLEKYDPTGMHKMYDKWPQIARIAYESDIEPIDFKNINHIIFAGMGGSGAMSDIFQAILSKTKIYVSVVKGYLLPKTIDSNTLVVITSVSGNTEETLTVLESASKLDCKIICFSSGGKLEEFCTTNKINYRKIPLYNNPRASFPAYLYSILKVLHSVIPINNDCIEESIELLENFAKRISSSNLTKTNPSLELAEWISNVTFIYYPSGLQAAAIRFKNSIQENIKSHAIIEDVIESCHNGVVAWETPTNIKPILLEGTEDYTKTKERWKILEEYFERKNIDYKVISSINGDILSKLIHLIYLLDYATIYRAVILGIDPSPVKSIDYIKARL